MSTLKNLAGQTAIYGLSTIVARLLNYLLVTLYTYNFTTGEYGLVTEMYSYTSFLMVIVTYGMETAFFRFSVGEFERDKVYSTALISLLLSTILFWAISIGFSGQIAGVIRHPDRIHDLIYVLLIIGLDAFTSIPFAKLREQNRASRFAFIKIINIAINIALNLFFIGLCKNAYEQPDSTFHDLALKVYNPKIGVGYVFLSNLISNLVVLFLLAPEVVKTKFRFDFNLWKKMMVYALPILLAGLAGMTNETMDRLLLKYLLPAGIAENQVGIYGACYKISIILTIFIQTFRYAAEPFFFNHAKEKNPQKLYADVMKYFCVACAFIALGTMVNLSWIQYMVGKPFRSGLAVVKILLVANFCLGVFYNLSIWYKLTNQTRFGAYLTGLGAVITLVLNFWLIPKIGYLGSAYATLVCYAIMMVVSYILGNKHYPVEYNLSQIFGYLILSLVLYLISKWLLQGPGLIKLALNNLLVISYLLIVFGFEKSRLKQYSGKWK